MSAIFPTRYSTLSADALKAHLAAVYALPFTGARLLVRNVSDTYLLETNSGKYIFKIYRDAHRKKEEIQGEIALLNALEAGSAPVAYCLRDKHGGQLQSFTAAEGTRYGIMLAYAPGKSFRTLSDMQLEATGRGIAAIHQVTEGLQLAQRRKHYDYETTISSPISLLEAAFREYEVPDAYAWLQQAAGKVLERLDAIDTTAFPAGYCHFDFLPKNFHFDNGDRVTFFDFDFAGEGMLAWDITTFYVHLFLETQYNKVSRAEADRMFAVFLGAYRSLRPFSEAALAALPYLGFGFWVFYLGFQYESYEDWSNLFFSSRFLEDRISLIRTWMEYSTGETWQ